MQDGVFSDRGVIFTFSGEEERPFPLDLVPRLASRFVSGTEQAGPLRPVATTKHFRRAVAEEVAPVDAAPRPMLIRPLPDPRPAVDQQGAQQQ